LGISQADFEGRGQLGALVAMIGPEEPQLGAADADPGEALRRDLLAPSKRLFGRTTPFVGRREALEEVYNGVRDAVRGERLGVISVTGAPGLGKTRLLAEALAIIDPAARGIGVWPILASQHDDDESIVAKLVRRRLGISPFERDQDAWDRVMSALDAQTETRQFGAHARGLGFLAGLRASGPDVLALGPDVQAFRRRAIRSFVDLLKADLAQTPQIVVVGMAHSLSDKAARALCDVFEALQDCPLITIFISEAGSDHVRPWPTGPDTTPAIEVDVGALEDRDVARLVRAVTAGADDEADTGESAAFIDSVVQHGAGSPGLAVANLRLLLQRGLVQTSESGLKDSVTREAFEAALRVAPLARDLDEASQLRVQELDSVTRGLLSAAALIGPRFERECAGVVASAIAHSQGLSLPVDIEEMADVFARCEDFGFIASEPDHAGEKLTAARFTHESDRLRLLDELGPQDALLAHAVAAQWLEAATADDVRADGPRWERIAQHWLATQRPREAAVALTEAAACARRGLSLDRARGLFRKALLVLGLRGPGGQAALLAHAATALPTLEAYAQLSNQTGDFQTAIPLFEASLVLSRVTRKRAALADAYFGLGFAHRGLGHYAASRSALEFARTHFRSIHAADGLAGCLVQLARLDWIEGGPEQRRDAFNRCDEALVIRRRLGDPRPLAETLVSLANIHIQHGDHEAARTLLEEARGLFQGLHDAAGEARSLVALGALAFYALDPARAIMVWRDALTLAERAGERELISALLNNLGEALIETGDYERAVVVLQESRELAEDGGDPRIHADALKNLATIFGRTERLDDAAEALADARAVAAQLRSPAISAQLDRVEALLLLLAPPTALSRGQAARGRVMFTEVLKTFSDLGDTFEFARTKAMLAGFVDDGA